MNKKSILLGSAAAVLLFAGSMFQSCTTAKDTKQNILAAEDFTTSENALAGAFEVSDDVASTDDKVKKGGSTILPSGAILTWIDTSFTDGDPVEFSLNFGALGTVPAMGMLCGDGKYRAGIIKIKLTQRYTTVGAKLTVTCADADNYYVGDGTNMYKVTGDLEVERTSTDAVKITTTDVTVKDLLNQTRKFSGIKTITRTAGMSSPGIWGDQYTVTGNGSGVTKDNENYTWNITTPLLKKMESGCAKTFTVGVIEVKNTGSNTSLKVDFDPFTNGACDKTARIYIGTWYKDIEVK